MFAQALLIALQVCANGPCSATQQTMVEAYRNCGRDLPCTQQAVEGGKIEVTASGVTVFRGQ